MLKRWIRFNSVGAIGVGVNFTVLTVLVGLLDVHYLVATALAVETAILHNFLWHERWTWSDHAGLHPQAVLERLLRFNLTSGAFSILGNLLCMRILVGSLGVNYLMANAITIACLSIFNFLVSHTFVYRVSLGKATEREASWEPCK